MIEFFINNIREIENSKSARENIRNLIGIIPNLQFIKENFLVRHNKSPKEKILVKLIIVQHQCLTSQMLFRINGQKFPQTLQNLVENLSRRLEAVLAAKGDQLHINAYGFRMGCYKSSCRCNV